MITSFNRNSIQLRISMKFIINMFLSRLDRASYRSEWCMGMAMAMAKAYINFIDIRVVLVNSLFFIRMIKNDRENQGESKEKSKNCMVKNNNNNNNKNWGSIDVQWIFNEIIVKFYGTRLVSPYFYLFFFLILFLFE